MQNVAALFFDMLPDQFITVLMNCGKIENEIVDVCFYLTDRDLDAMPFKQDPLDFGHLTVFPEAQSSDLNNNAVGKIGAGRYDHRKLSGLP